MRRRDDERGGLGEAVIGQKGSQSSLLKCRSLLCDGSLPLLGPIVISASHRYSESYSAYPSTKPQDDSGSTWLLTMKDQYIATS